ncbi:Cytochrome P450 monooxygenase PikC [Streptomyces sp. RB5]|uniref:Cytochrome P450 monooxygenase PikC n=2 Tax=Streptomyces smaragdinus TaxID=2585196 RepID=A0A7K0CDT3_9ACTN|nr:cytochrome P450 [Streptomyces smaragdinus]MQY11513.1 Cytochrome P450 monooxygenase PikC [Streptomyces smaragdinus]
MPALYERLRAEHGPVAPVLIAPGIPAWLVLGFTELLRVARDERSFSHDPRNWRLLREGRVAADSPIMPTVDWRPALLYTDGRQHRRMRSAVSAALERINGHALRRTVRATAERLISEFAEQGRADLVPHYARKLPLQVVTQLLGLDERSGQQLVQATLGTAAANADSANASGRMTGILTKLIEAQRSGTAGDGFIATLARHPAGLTDDEILHNLVVVFVAANQPTVDWIATTLRILLTDPALGTSVAGGRLTIDDALDQALWRHPPVQNYPARYALRAVEFGGQPIRAGDMLVLGLAGANADPSVRPPDGCPVTGNRSHLAFGAGPHACPSQDLARLITRTAVDTLLHRLPDLELAVPEKDLAWTTSPWAPSLAALPVRL